MRIITGTARGTRLKTLDGLETRPTAEKVKEAIFSIIQFDIEGRTMLDLFAGSGQLGAEALSRGAAKAIFIDNSKAAVEIIRGNIEKCKLGDRAEIRLSDYRAALLSSKSKFGVIFIDPPYMTGQLQRALSTISGLDIVADNGIIVCESDRNDVLPDDLPGFLKSKDYLYSHTKVTLYRKISEAPELSAESVL